MEYTLMNVFPQLILKEMSAAVFHKNVMLIFLSLPA